MPIDVVRRVDVCAFRGRVSAERAIFIWMFFVVIIGEARRAAAVPGRGDHHNATAEGRRGGGEEGGFEQVEEQEVCEVVGAELGFEAVGIAGEGGDCHDAGVADEDIEAAAFVALEELFCACAHAG